jgi:hypothetical protein
MLKVNCVSKNIYAITWQRETYSLERVELAEPLVEEAGGVLLSVRVIVLHHGGLHGQAVTRQLPGSLGVQQMTGHGPWWHSWTCI